MSPRNPLRNNEAIARKFQLLDRAVIEGDIVEPKKNFLGNYIWFSNFKLSFKTFSMGAFLLGLPWYIHYGLIEEVAILFLITYILLSFAQFLPLLIFVFVYAVVWIISGCLFTSTLYAKYKIKGNITIDPNIFKTIFISIVIWILVTFAIEGIIKGLKPIISLFE